MKKIASFIVFCLFFTVILNLIGFEKQPDRKTAESPLLLEISDRPVIYNPSRIGLNLGTWGNSGTDQYSKNIFMNPGFEGDIERLIVIVSQVNQESFSDEAGLGYPDHYFDLAQFEIRTGTAAGKKGIITRSLNSGENGYPQYFTTKYFPEIKPNDIIVLTKKTKKNINALWHSDNPELIHADSKEKAPGSHGELSIKLNSTKTVSAKLHFYADRFAEIEGNKRLIEGSFNLSLWAKGEAPSAELEIVFQRNNGKEPFLKETLSLSTEWRQYTLRFTGKDTTQPGILNLTLTALRPGMAIWIDDISLEPDEKNTSAFRKEVIEALNDYKPSYLREFTPFNDTWENRIAPGFARKVMNYQTTGGPHQNLYNYSLQDFLSLCSEVHANPWLIVPVAFSEHECSLFGQFLAKHAGKERFSDVIVEFGANNWNWFYRPVGIPYPQAYGELASRSFAAISSQTKNLSNIRFFVNGQFSIPHNALKFIERTKNADGLAVTPYFFNTLNKATPDKKVLQRLFKEDGHLMRAISDELFSKRKSFAISEINLNTREGDAKFYERNRIVSGAASGPALAKKILESLYAGADPILVNGLAGLWGIVQDFGPPLRFKPTGLSMIMLNQVIGGNMYAIKPVGASSDDHKALMMASFKTPNSWTAAITSKGDKPLILDIRFPDDHHPLPSSILTLEASSPFETNEKDENVKIIERNIASTDRTIQVTIPAWGFIVLK